MDEADLDLCGYKTSCSTASYGEAGAGVPGRANNNPGATKVVKTVLLSDANCFRSFAYIHRDKLHRKPYAWTLWVTLT